MKMYISERLIIEDIVGKNEVEVFINEYNQIFIGNEYSAFVLNKEEFEFFVNFVSKQFDTIDQQLNLK